MEIENVENQTLESTESNDPIAEHIESVAKEDGEQAPSVEEKEAPVVDEESPKEESGDEAQPQVEEVKAYEPDLSYTFRGKKYEMPEELKGLIDSPEKQEFYHDLFTKARGLEVVKAEGLKAQESYQALSQDVQQFMAKAQVGDLKGAFEHAGIERPTIDQAMRGLGFSDEDIVKHALHIAEMSKAHPDYRQATDRQFEMDQRLKQYEMQIQNMQTQQQQQLQSQIINEMQEVVSDQTFAPIAQKFDELHGEGAFNQEIIARGEQIYRLENRIARPRELAKQIVDRYNLGSLISQQANQTQSSQPAQTQSKQSVPVIPAVEGGGGSPAQREITSIEDLEKIYQEKFGQ